MKEPGLSEEYAVMLDHKLAVAQLAIKGLRAYEQAEPYAKQFDFAPSEVGENTKNAPGGCVQKLEGKSDGVRQEEPFCRGARAPDEAPEGDCGQASGDRQRKG
eukprot:Polyplicarium_translucidae@DN3378_c0_g1_i3.p1